MSKETREANALMELTEWAEENNIEGPEDLSVNHDKYIWEEEKCPIDHDKIIHAEFHYSDNRFSGGHGGEFKYCWYCGNLLPNTK